VFPTTASDFLWFRFRVQQLEVHGRQVCKGGNEGVGFRSMLGFASAKDLFSMLEKEELLPICLDLLRMPSNDEKKCPG